MLSTSPGPESRFRERDPNPRGGVRGARGVGTYGDRLVVTNSERLFVLDRAWDTLGAFEHPHMSGVHDVLCEEDGIFVTCASSDILLKLDWDGRPMWRWSWRDDRDLVRALGFTSVPAFDETADYRDPARMGQGVSDIVHLNAVTRAADGSLLLGFGRILARQELNRRLRRTRLEALAARARVERPARAVERALSARRRRRGLSTATEAPIHDSAAALVSVSESPSTGALVRLFGAATGGVPAHNALEVADKLVVNDSGDGAVVVYDADTAREEARIVIPGDPPWPRGLALLPDGGLVVGGQRPAALHLIDSEFNGVVSSCELDGEPNETVYAVTVLPEVFEDPPPVLEQFGGGLAAPLPA